VIIIPVVLQKRLLFSARVHLRVLWNTISCLKKERAICVSLLPPKQIISHGSRNNIT